jgi:gp16 family phage-associated protein
MSRLTTTPKESKFPQDNFNTSVYGTGAIFMDKEQRKKIIAHHLVDLGETITSWATKNGLHQKIVTDLIVGKLKGTRGVSLVTRQKMEDAFGEIFRS